MKKLALLLGRAVFWLSFPALVLILRRSHRTRALIICGNEFLVLRNWLSSGDWILPGGGVHRGEDPLAGLIREVHEEIGVDLVPEQIVHLHKSLFRSRGIIYTYDSFFVKLSHKPVLRLQAREIADYAWIPLDDPRLKLAKDVQRILARWKQTA